MTTPAFPDVVKKFIEGKLVNLHVSIPASVVSYDRLKQSIDAQPLIGRNVVVENDTTKLEFLPVINKVPVLFGRHTWPIAVGEYVLLVFSTRSLDRWLALGGMVDPEDNRHHDKNDAFAIPGLFSFREPLPAEATSDDASVVYEPDDLRLGDADADDPIVRKSDLDAFMNILATTVDGAGAIAALYAALQAGGTPPNPLNVWPNPRSIVKSK